MAITIHKEPTGIYPAYNDSYIVLSSNLSNNIDMTVQVLPEGTVATDFVVYKDTNGQYTFNFKDIVRSILDTNGFEDGNATPPVNFGESISVGYVNQQFGITVSDGSGSTDITSQSYEFIRGVKQIGETVHDNPTQILNYSTNGIDYNLTYFDGFPFTFELQRVSIGDNTHIKNLNTGVTSSALVASSTDTFRYWVDKGSTNWTNSTFLPLTDTVNRLEIYLTGSFATNLNLKKKEQQCGVYLKWFNNDGGYSYWLFDEYYRDTLKNNVIGSVARNEFLNVGEGLKNKNKLIGKVAGKRWRLKTQVDNNEIKVLESLFTSPTVQLYSSQQPFNEGQWIDVELMGDYVISNKKRLNEVNVQIELPELNTITL